MRNTPPNKGSTLTRVPVYTPTRNQPPDIEGIRVALGETMIPLGGWRAIIESLLDDIDDWRETYPERGTTCCVCGVADNAHDDESCIAQDQAVGTMHGRD